MTSALLPCPFCGGAASDTGVIHYNKAAARDVGDGRQRDYFFCNCTRCGVSNQGLTGYRTKEEAVAAWSQRGNSTGFVAVAIAAYRSAVEADEALFNADGDLLVSASEADASEKACKAAWMDLMSAPCLSMDDVRAKVEFITGPPLRTFYPVIDELVPDWCDPLDEAGPLRAFLRSLAPSISGAP